VPLDPFYFPSGASFIYFMCFFTEESAAAAWEAIFEINGTEQQVSNWDAGAPKEEENNKAERCTHNSINYSSDLAQTAS